MATPSPPKAGGSAERPRLTEGRPGDSGAARRYNVLPGRPDAVVSAVRRPPEREMARYRHPGRRLTSPETGARPATGLFHPHRSHRRAVIAWRDAAPAGRFAGSP